MLCKNVDRSFTWLFNCEMFGRAPQIYRGSMVSSTTDILLFRQGETNLMLWRRRQEKKNFLQGELPDRTIQSLEIRRSTFPNGIEFAYLRISRLKNSQRVGRVAGVKIGACVREREMERKTGFLSIAFFAATLRKNIAEGCLFLLFAIAIAINC